MASPPNAEALLDTILEGIGLPFYAVDKDWRIYLYNQAAERHFGQPAEKMIGTGLWDHFAEDRTAERGRRRRNRAVALRGPSQAAAERAQSPGEDTLAIVQSIATLTLNGVSPDARAAFEERLLNLSAVHNLLTDESWNSTSLASVARTSLRAARERVSFAGDDLRLRPKSAVALSMALHELGTNALKYGALSTERGRVSVQWTTDDGRFRLRWEEMDGPPVSPPGHRGFGSRMIERGLAAEPRGEVRIDWQPQGVVCTVDEPIEAIRDQGPLREPPPGSGWSRTKCWSA